MRKIFLSILLVSCIHFTLEASLSSELYGPNDRIHLVNTTNFKSTIVGSQTAWLVEFYSSWCGHCINFAPTFKQLAADVYGWRDVISVAAIDCAQDYNTEVCREYEIMGYPSMRLFPPDTQPGYVGQDLRKMTQEAIKSDMIEYVIELQKNNSNLLKKWPNLQLFSGLRLDDLWIDSSEFYALLLVDREGSNVASQVILDIAPSIRKLNIPLQLRRAVKSSDNKGFLQKQEGQGILVLNKELSHHSQLTAEYTREAWYTAIKDYIWSKSKDFALSGARKEDFSLNRGGQEPQDAKKKEEKSGSKKDLINRRYKVFLSDLEKAMVYSLSHEVAQHTSVVGKQLVALQKYITVLDKFFPSRPEVEVFLKDLRGWVHKHEDAIRGEDLANWMQTYTGDHGIKINEKWIGCQGSAGQYGGYPCGLWSMWHALTISQAKLGVGGHDEVLRAMQGFIQEFFGCRECARHFDQTIQQGEGIKENVDTYKSAVLYLWNVHNRVNVRLSGDISDDPVFPKQVFPAKEFCSKCYNDKADTNLWDEFDREEVYEFLLNQFSMSKISRQGLPSDQIGGVAVESHALAPLPQVDDLPEEDLDLDNYKKERSKVRPINFIFFNGMDISMCLFLWLSSALIIVLLYMKFVVKKRFSNTALMSLLRRKTSYNPLLGKV